MKIIILHGTYGSPDGNWFQWLKKELLKSGHQVYIPTLPTPEKQNIKNWHNALKEQTPCIDENTILIGHSCGATYILHILEELTIPINKSILISGFINKLGNKEYDILNKSFINHSFNWKNIIKNAGEIILVHGDNDPYVPIALAKNLANNLRSKLNIIPNGGHLNSESGYTKFPELLPLI